MPRLLRTWALVSLSLLAYAGCAAVEGPQEGSPGLEPPRSTEDGGSLGEDVDPGEPAAGGRGSGASAGTTGSGVGPAAGVGGATDPMTAIDAGSADAGEVPFSELHQTERMYDCVQSVQCFQQRDTPLEPDPIDGCLQVSAALLDANSEQQERFLANFARCSALIVCDYYDCVNGQ